MALDLGRIAIAAVEAAFDQQEAAGKKHKRRHLPATRALLIGAGLMTVGRVALSGRGHDLLNSLEERLTQFEGGDRGADASGGDDEEFEDEGFDEVEAEQEPDDYDEEPEGYEDEDYDEEEEPENYEDEGDYDEDDEWEAEESDEEVDERRARRSAGSRAKRRG